MGYDFGGLVAARGRTTGVVQFDIEAHKPEPSGPLIRANAVMALEAQASLTAFDE